jgi:hypothetical protein
VRIRRLFLRDVKRHASLDLDLAPGLTVVRGPNEAGKTTIQRAIELLLFRKPTATGQDIDQMRRWDAQPDASPTVVADFEEDGRSGRLAKRFGGSRGTVLLRLGEEQTNDANEVERRVTEFIGLPSEKAYRSTANVRHEEMDDLTHDEATLRDRLQVSMSGGDHGTSVAKRKLDEAIRRHRTEGAKNPGHVKVAHDRVAALSARLRQGEAELERLERDQRALSVARATRAALDERLGAEREQLESAERAVQLLDEQRRAEERYARFRRAADLERRITESEAQGGAAVPMSVLQERVGKLRELDRAALGLDREMSALGRSTVSRSAPGTGGRSWSVTGGAAGALLLIGALLAIVGPIVGIPSGAAIGLGALFAGLGVAAAAVALQARSREAEERAVRAREDAEAKRRDAARAALEQQLHELDRARASRLAQLGVPDIAAAETLLATETARVAATEQIRAELRGLLGDERVERPLAELRDESAAEAERKRHALSAMTQGGTDPARERDRLTALVRGTVGERERAIREEAQAQARVEQNPVDAEQVATFAEQLAVAEARLAAAERRARVLELTRRSLQAAEEATMKKAARYLEERMTEDVARITDGRYRRLTVDEATLTFRVFSEERGDWIDIRHLSQGTVDQFYLAARLGLVSQISGDRRPPLVLDDPFVTFDDARAARAMELLRSVAGEHQIVYLTCSSRYDSYADLVVELAAPAAADAAPQPDQTEAPGAPATADAPSASEPGRVRAIGGGA